VLVYDDIRSSKELGFCPENLKNQTTLEGSSSGIATRQYK
jgi:hypothetical protein